MLKPVDRERRSSVKALVAEIRIEARNYDLSAISLENEEGSADEKREAIYAVARSIDRLRRASAALQTLLGRSKDA